MTGYRLAAIALAAVGLAVAWRVATFGLAGYFAGDDAGLALTFDDKHPDALVRLADERLSDGESGEAASLARRAVQARPLNAPALRVLGFAASDQQDEARAGALMAGSADLSRRELPANAWMFNKALADGDYARAYRHADVVLRRSPDSTDRLFPKMIGGLDHPAAIEAVAERLSHAPVWRGTFLATLTGQASDETLQGVLSRVQAGPRPLTDQEMSWVLRRRLAEHDERTTRAFWAGLLSPADRARVSHIYDGGFETAVGVQPFGWQRTPDASVSTRFAETGGANGKALQTEHFGPKGARILRQLLVLDAGAWRLSGRAMAGGGPDDLAWTISCGREQIASVSPGEGAGWRPFETAFTVPAGCATQVLALEVRQGGGATSAWFDDLKIEPAGGAS